MTGRANLLGATLAVCTLAANAPTAAAQGFVNTGDGVFASKVTSLRDMPFRTVVRQQYDYSCGSAALATLLKFHYGRALSEADVFKAMFAVGDQTAIRRAGFSLLDMKAYLSSVGLQADGYRQSFADLVASKAPAIAVITVGAYRHFVVIKGASNREVLVGDPAQGLKTYDAASFKKVWSGIVFLIHGTPQRGFNSADEWANIPRAPISPLDDATLSDITRALPSVYQITAFRVMGQ